MNPDLKLQDHALRILRSVAIPDSVKGDAWDAFHNSASHTDLAQALKGIAGLPTDVQAQLVDARQMSLASTEPLDKAVEAVNRISSIDHATLDLAEAHPNVLKAFTNGGE